MIQGVKSLGFFPVPKRSWTCKGEPMHCTPRRSRHSAAPPSYTPDVAFRDVSD